MGKVTLTAPMGLASAATYSRKDWGKADLVAPPSMPESWEGCTGVSEARAWTGVVACRVGHKHVVCIALLHKGWGTTHTVRGKSCLAKMQHARCHTHLMPCMRYERAWCKELALFCPTPFQATAPTHDNTVNGHMPPSTGPLDAHLARSG